ncbi:poly-gamma-glutamate hydrolase family protein [Sulfitobacter sp. S0837]|uniref:poly-gamma-glutamate hydrolase family protein n=1 Tax=Sulfitobacter maritimus TaxID=2741719 RepID=UPI0015827F6C|nr:poly-gamma-glutamate hydrolase family protein [Sulfitobacter maritimus]NUH66447.1 poly-gamma-glutamate hydrolase family protein [Sulfitobacter maritimus]
MADRFQNFKDLSDVLSPDTDYAIRSAERDSDVVILAPHGGTIEPETSAIAEAIAGDTYSFYAFEALKPGAHGDLHITSHLFDEPTALDLVSRSRIAVAIHGRKDDGTDSVWLGGRAAALRDAIGAALRVAGFEAERNTTLPGIHETNICNRTRRGEGVQLELSRSLRRKLADDPALLDKFSAALREAIEAENAR